MLLCEWLGHTPTSIVIIGFETECILYEVNGEAEERVEHWAYAAPST